MEIQKISVLQAAKIMGISPQFLRLGLQRKEFPFGFAIKRDDASIYSYYINPKQFYEYIGR